MKLKNMEVWKLWYFGFYVISMWKLRNIFVVVFDSRLISSGIVGILLEVRIVSTWYKLGLVHDPQLLYATKKKKNFEVYFFAQNLNTITLKVQIL